MEGRHPKEPVHGLQIIDYPCSKGRGEHEKLLRMLAKWVCLVSGSPSDFEELLDTSDDARRGIAHSDSDVTDIGRSL